VGRLAVRHAVAEYFANAGLEHVGTIFTARPEILEEAAYEENRMKEAVESEHGSSAVLVVAIPSDDRMRRADTGRGAVNDSRIHKVVIEIFFASTSGDAVAAQDDYDGIVDSMVALIRADATLGDPSVVWSAGEYTAGISHQQGEPYTDADGLTVFIAGVVRCEVYEWIAGPV
jgi:hypothetical protein